MAGENRPPVRERTTEFSPILNVVTPAGMIALNNQFQNLYAQLAALRKRVYDLENPKG